VPEWTPAGVCILGWSRSRSQYFKFEQESEPESTLRSVQEPNKILFLEDLLKFLKLCLLFSNRMEFIKTCFLIGFVIYHESVTLGGSTDHFTTTDGFKVSAYAKYSV